MGLCEIVGRDGIEHSEGTPKVVAICMIVPTCPAYADWGPWQTIGDGAVKVRFSQIKSDVCTWEITNIGYRLVCSGSCTCIQIRSRYKPSSSRRK